MTSLTQTRSAQAWRGPRPTFRRIASLCLAAAAGLSLSACEPGSATGPSNPAGETFAPALEVNLAAMTKFSDDLYYQDIVVGTGTTLTTGKSIVVAYSGYLVDGTKFDSQSSLGPVPLTESNLITGWVYGLPGMKVGGTRKLVIGSSYAYGAQGRGSIPANATLVFDIELKAVQ